LSTLARGVAVLLLVGVLLAGGVSPVLADTDLQVGSLAIIANTNTDAIMVRSGAGYAFQVLSTVEEGDIVTVVDGPLAGDDGNLWYEVDLNGLDGFVFADYLVLPENAPLHPVRAATVARVAAPAAPAAGKGYAAAISGTGGDGVRLRDSARPDGAIILTIPEGGGVEVLGEPQSGGGRYWYPVGYGGETGWVAGDFVGGQGTMVAATVTTPVAAKAAAFASGTHVKVSGTGDDDVRIRGWAGLDGAIEGYAPAGAVLLVLGGPELDDAGNAWYPVDYDGLSGYTNADFLSWTGQGLSARQVAPAAPVVTVQAAPAVAAAPAAEPPPPPPPPPAPPPAPAAKAVPAAKATAPPAAPASNASGGNGAAMVAVAMKYLGAPYVWGGTSPAGFDCSGFANYVTRQALGINIGNSVEGQIGAGRAVGAKELQPGDLVFFANTYAPGITHVGVYIGGGRWVSAQDEKTGVVIIRLDEPYWKSRYAGARRIT
jgi:peptidoglycan DL-endopeptidase LytF